MGPYPEVSVRSQLRRLAIRSLLPLSWKLSPGRVSSSLLRFAEVEADSAWQFLRAMEVLEQPHQRAAMFHDAIEEMEHSAGFYTLARTYASRPLPLCRDRREALLTGPEGLGEFLTYIYEGEREVYEEFEDYTTAAGRQDIQDWLTHIREDEEGHQDTALATLIEVLGGEQELARLVRSIRWRRNKESLARLSHRIGNLFSGVLLGSIFLVAGPLFGWACKQRMDSARGDRERRYGPPTLDAAAS